MNIDTVTVSPAEAERKLSAARSLTDRQRIAEDQRWAQLYKALRGGARVLNLHDAFRKTGVNDKGQPRLAIARADWPNVWYHPTTGRIACVFTPEAWHNERATRKNIYLPLGVFGDQEKKLTWNLLRSPVPYVPPDVRPQFALRNYHILFEVEQWNVYPHDPYLLRHVGGQLYIVLAEWDLTPLEVSLFAEEAQP